ncbi:Fc.00g060120.m01.CDS01 [Cosmosporella sp. VM-42]
MPYRLSTHVLTVDANVIHKVDTGNPANLYSMWTVFSRCADSVEQGRRLENLSWRLWQRETFVVDSDKAVSADNTNTHTLPQNIPTEHRLPEVPQLSGSVDSLLDEEAVDFTSVSAPLDITRPRVRRQDSCTSSRSKRERHISSDDFEKMIVSIVKDKGPLSAPPAPPKVEIPLPPPAFERSGSTTTESQSSSKSVDEQSEPSPMPSPETPSRTTVVRGFSPSQVPIPRTIPSTIPSIATDAIPEPTSSPAPKPVQSKKQPARFALGGSCSSSEQDQSLDNRKPMIPIVKKPMFTIGGSSEEDGSLKSALASSRPGSLLSHKKKQASFANDVMTHTINDEAAIDSDTDYIDESAIDDDDDSSDWEDSIEDSGKSSLDDKLFQRVDSKRNLTSRPSLITLMLAQGERARNLGNHASQSTSAIPRSRVSHGPSLGASPNDSDEAPLMMKGTRQPTTLRPIHEIPRSSAQPIQAQAALSPRTTRRNMLATELTESLRRHLLWERQQKSSTANAVLKRRHTSHDVANLKQYPEKACIKQSEDVNASSWNQYFSKEASNGYHSKGW